MKLILRRGGGFTVSRRFISIVAAGIVSAWLTLTVFYAQAHVKITTDLTWSEDVQPIFKQKCMTCHNPNGIAPEYVNLTTYGNKPGQSGARDWAKAIEEEILTGRMPPWPADPRFGEFANDRRLTKAEKDTIIGWIQGGGPQGPRRDLPPPAEFAKRDWTLGKPDLEIEMPEEFVIPSGKREGEFSFKFNVPKTFGTDQTGKDKTAEWITAFEFMPGDPKSVQSISAYIHDPMEIKEETIEVEVQKPYDPLADEDALEEKRARKMPLGIRFLGQYKRGDAPVILPEEAGMKLRGGSTISVNVFYRKQGVEGAQAETRDRSKLGIHFAKRPVDLLVESFEMLPDKGFVVPADGNLDAEVKTSHAMEEAVHLIGLNPQLGSFGKSLEVTATHPDGKTQTLLYVPNAQEKWESSFVFESPIPVPKGTRIDAHARYKNPGKEGSLRFGIYADYYLDDHLIVVTPTPPPSPKIAQGSGMLVTEGIVRDSVLFGDDFASDTGTTMNVDISSVPNVADVLGSIEQQPADDTYWCPMRGTKPGSCGLKDYHGPGECEKCGMKLKPKASFFEKVPKDQMASKQGTWELTPEGTEAVYWCPNRGREDHILRDYVAPVKCDVCGSQFLHKSQFKNPKTFACTNTGCSLHYDESKGMTTVFYTPGQCPECLQPVEPMGHMDHTPVHGGQLIMAENLYHHVEGTLPAADEFRIYFYDDWKKPLDPRNFAGKVVFETFDEKTEEVKQQEIELVQAKSEDGFLTAKIPAVSEFPVDFNAKVFLAGKETLFSFAFKELSKEPAPGQGKGVVRAHTHIVRPPLYVPKEAKEIIAEIVKRSEIITRIIDSKDWLNLHIPCLEAADLAQALKEKEAGLDAQTRGRLRKAITQTTLGALNLHDFGDLMEEGRIAQARADFEAGLKEIKAVFPAADKP